MVNADAALEKRVNLSNAFEVPVLLSHAKQRVVVDLFDHLFLLRRREVELGLTFRQRLGVLLALPPGK